MKKLLPAVGVLTISIVLFGGMLLSGGDEADMDDIKVMMTGRSTMSLWFKHWNWPKLLRWKTTYRAWPISWETKSKDGLFLVYREMPHPGQHEENQRWGENMVASFSRALVDETPDVAFFKFCFVDFQVTESNDKQRFADLLLTVEEVYHCCRDNNVSLVLGNALPLAKPTPQAIVLQKRFNNWAEDFCGSRDDVMVFDLYSPFVDENGSLRRELWRSGQDHHPSDKAFNGLDEKLFGDIPLWARTQKQI